MSRPLLLILAGALLFASAGRSDAQQRPSPSEAAALLRSRPDLIVQLRDRLRASGLTPAQIRSRLEAEGYPSSLLDAYLNDGTRADSASAPSSEVLSAIAALGIADSSAIDTLRRASRPRVRVGEDSVLTRLADSLGVTVNQLVLAADTLPVNLRRRIQARTRGMSGEAKIDSGYTLFGRQIFERESTQFDANLSGPVDASYRLGPGDRLVLILTGDVEVTHTLDVTREGFVVIPQVGQIYVSSLTLGDLTNLLIPKLARLYPGVGRGANAGTRLSLSVARLRSNQIYVTGDVTTPGTYRISSAGTMLSALYAAGGPTVNGDMRQVALKRGDRTVATLDLYDYLVKGNPRNDLRLENGDVIFVPARGGRVRIWGEVIRPATYELKPGETLDAMLQAAGGLTEQADRRRVQIDRILPPSLRTASGRDRVTLDVRADSAGVTGTLPLQSGDVVRVYAIAERVRSRVVVLGNVWSPGPVSYTSGMRLSDALRRAGGVQPDTYLGQVLVSRLRADSTRLQLRDALRDSTGSAVTDITLQDGDEVTVFSQTDLRPERYVVASGAVRKAGRYPYREGMTLSDLVLQAGGLEEWAVVTDAEIARLPENRQAGVTAVTQRVQLDRSFAALRGDESTVGSIPLAGGGGANIPLKPYDNVLIYRDADWVGPRTVSVGGEVRRPGRYTLERKSERLSDIIERAGGLTKDANPAGIVFVRPEGRVGRIGVELPEVLANANHRDNLTLASGDSIYIPIFSPVVQVRGAVNSPAGVAYVRGESIDYYIAAAGGATEKGTPSRAYVTQSNGRVESRRSRSFGRDIVPEPGPGSVVVVPSQNAQVTDSNIAQTLITFTQIVSGIVGIIYLARH